MSEELPKQMSRPEKINLWATVVGPIVVSIVVGWAGWSFKASMKMALDERDKFNADTYVSKAWFQTSHDELEKKIDKVSDNVDQVAKDVATIKGEMATEHKP